MRYLNSQAIFSFVALPPPLGVETKSEKQEVSKMETNQPETKFISGAIQAAIWKNQTVKDGKVSEFRTISLQRSYKDKDDKWQHTTSLRASDLPRARLVLDEAYRFVALNQQN